ncbi:MAG: hypothetical protein AAF530_25795 [Pseudomonadota bacterium]
MKYAICLSLVVVCASPAFSDQSLGVASINVTDEDQTRPLSLSLWYPGDGGTQETVAGNAVFTGVIAGRDASKTVDRLPVVMISHGGLRSAGDSGAWLSAALARAGYLAVEINAPRPSKAADAVNEIWHRPKDVSRALDAILNDPAWSEHIDQGRISVVGFALGGTAALALGGGEFEPQSFVRSCNTIGAGPDCAWFQAQNVVLGSVDRDELTESRRDSRVSSIVAVSPEYLDVFFNGLPSINLSSIHVPALLVSLGSNNTSHSSAQANNFTQAAFPDASMFDGFQICTSAGPAILSDEGGDPALCGTSAKERQRTHEAIVGEIVAFLGALPRM